MIKARLIGLFLSCLLFAGLQAQTPQEQLKQIRSTVTDTVNGNVFFLHTIKRGQTLYMISKAYGVEVNDIIRENPQVKEGIKADEILRIPVKNAAPKPPKPAPEPIKEKPPVQPPVDTTIIEASQPPEQKVLPCGMDRSAKKEEYRVALMLPLFLDDLDQINTENPDRSVRDNTRSFQFLPFYEGFRMALDSLEDAGLNVRLYVYDVDKDTVKTKQMLKKSEMESMDMIIGLLYHRNFQIVSAFAAQHGIPIVNPISERSEIVERNPHVIKLQPAKRGRATELAAYLADHCTDGPVIIIRSGQSSDRNFADDLSKACKERQLEVQVADGQTAAIEKLVKSRENYVIAFSEKPDYTIDLTRRLYELRNEYSMTLFGLPDWSSINGIETDYLVTLKTHVMSPAFIDYSDDDVKKFVRRYQSDYHADPPLLAFQGFDIAWYFLTALHQYGTSFLHCLDEHSPVGMSADMKFSGAGSHGPENQKWMIMRFENYRLVPVNRY